MTLLDLWLTLTQAEARVKEYKGSQFDFVAVAAQDTVNLCQARMAREGLTRGDLQKAAKREAA